MPEGRLPSIAVEIAFNAGFGTPEADRVWTDVTDYLEGQQPVTITRGRGDEHAAPQPSTLSLTLDNRDGRFTPDRSGSPYFPNVKLQRPIRIRARSGGTHAPAGAATATDVSQWVTGDAFGAFTPALALEQSTTFVHDLPQVLRISWPDNLGKPSAAWVWCDGLVPGLTYTASAWVRVPTGAPDVSVGVLFGGTGAPVTVKSAWRQATYTFTASATFHLVTIQAATPVNNAKAFVAELMLNEGATPAPFTTRRAAPIRFLGYIDSWPTAWSDGTDSVAKATITASSRRARLGRNAGLPAALETEILADTPYGYWPLSAESPPEGQRPTLSDVTGNNPPAQFSGAVETVLGDRDGPIDDGSMVKLPQALYPDVKAVDFPVRGGFARSDCTIEVTIRAAPNTASGFTAWGKRGKNEQANFSLSCESSNADEDINYASIAAMNMIVNQPWVASDLSRPWLGNLIAAITHGPTGAQQVLFGPGDFTAAPDELHHFAMTLTEYGRRMQCWVDGKPTAVTPQLVNGVAPLSYIRLTSVAGGVAWVSHVAIYRQALSADRIQAHARAATDGRGETSSARMRRVARYAELPLTELQTAGIDPILPQSIKGRGPSEVFDEIAAGTNAVVYDDRAGPLVLTDRRGRYNAPTAFTASGSTEEVQAALEPIHDDQALINTAEVTSGAGETAVRATYEDAPSRTEYGVYSTQRTSLIDDARDPEALASWMVSRYAAPKLRVRQVGFDLVNVGEDLALAVLAADIGTPFVLADMPAQVASTMRLLVEGYTETITARTHSIVANTSPGDLDAAWVLDSTALSVLGATTRTAY